MINEGKPDELLEPLDSGDLHVAHREDLESVIQHTVTHAATPDNESEQDETRRFGDSSMYAFYARAAGRGTLVGLAVCMAIYAFCQAFPSKSFDTVVLKHLLVLTHRSTLDRMVGWSGRLS